MDRTDKVQLARTDSPVNEISQDLVVQPLPKRRVLNTCRLPSNCH